MVDVPQESPPEITFEQNSDTEFLLEYLKTHDTFCPLCNYNLRNLTVPRCPECGREIRLTVGMVEPFLLPWILLTILISMAAGVGVLFTGAVVFFGPPPLPELIRDAPLMCLALSYGIICVPMTVILVAVRRGIWRLPGHVQWTLVALAFILNAVFVLGSFVSAARP